MNIDLSHENIERITGDKLRRLEMEELEESFYDMGYIENLEENDEISMNECAFMVGYIEAS